MGKRGFIKIIKEKITGFFEKDEEEINCKTLIIIFLIGLVIIIYIYVHINKGFEFMKFGLDGTGYMEQNNNRAIIQIEDYFIKMKGLENSDFSEGINHWSTYKRNQFYNQLTPNITLNEEAYHSSPQSLQITCLESSCRIYYNTKSNSVIIDNIYSDHLYDAQSGIWMGIEQETNLRLSYWYKGDKHQMSILTLDKYGDFYNLESIESNDSKKWIKKEITLTIPYEARAFGISIMIGYNGYLLFDDIQLEKI